MTLEERIKEFRNNIQLGGFANMLDENSFYCSLLKDASKIIDELRNKNKELTRLEVIDESGRVYINNNCKMELSYQDEGRTLKIFVDNEER